MARRQPSYRITVQSQQPTAGQYRVALHTSRLSVKATLPRRHPPAPLKRWAVTYPPVTLVRP